MKGLIEKGLSGTALLFGWLLVAGLSVALTLYAGAPLAWNGSRPLLTAACAVLALWMLAAIGRCLLMAVQHRRVNWLGGVVFLLGVSLLALSVGLNTWLAATETVRLPERANVELQGDAFAGYRLIRQGETLIFATPEQVRWHQSATVGHVWSVDAFRGIVAAADDGAVTVQVHRVGASKLFHIGLVLILVGGIPVWLHRFEDLRIL